MCAAVLSAASGVQRGLVIAVKCRPEVGAAVLSERGHALVFSVDLPEC